MNTNSTAFIAWSEISLKYICVRLMYDNWQIYSSAGFSGDGDLLRSRIRQAAGIYHLQAHRMEAACTKDVAGHFFSAPIRIEGAIIFPIPTDLQA